MVSFREAPPVACARERGVRLVVASALARAASSPPSPGRYGGRRPSTPLGTPPSVSKGRKSRLVIHLEAALFHFFLAALAAVFLDHAPVEQVDRPVGVAGVARVVRDHADGRAFAMQLA